eukprot:7062275-Prymnesium_polylepis.1
MSSARASSSGEAGDAGDVRHAFTQRLLMQRVAVADRAAAAARRWRRRRWRIELRARPCRSRRARRA